MIVAGGEDIGALFSATTQGALALAETDLDMGKPMATSLYDLSVPTFLQTVRAVGGFLDRAAKHCAETGADPDDFVPAQPLISSGVNASSALSAFLIGAGGWAKGTGPPCRP